MRTDRAGAATAPAPYLLEYWYQAAWDYELDAGPLARALLDVPVLIFRESGRVFALLDRCPHRFAPLSAGKVKGGVIECGYHGLAFDGTGRCVRNPHGPITASMRTRSFVAAVASAGGHDVIQYRSAGWPGT